MSSNISFVINKGTSSITGLFVSDFGDVRQNEREFITTFSAKNIDYLSRFLNIIVLHGRDSISDQVKAWPNGKVTHKYHLTPRFTEELFYAKNFGELREKIIRFAELLRKKYNYKHKPDIIFDNNIVKICFSNVDCVSVMLHRNSINDFDELPSYMFNGKLYESETEIEISPYLDLVILPSVVNSVKEEKEVNDSVLKLFREVFYKDNNVDDNEIVTPLYKFYEEFSSKVKVITIGNALSSIFGVTSTEIIDVIYRLYYALFYINSFYGDLPLDYVPYLRSCYNSYKIGEVQDLIVRLSFYEDTILMIVVDVLFKNNKRLAFVFTDSIVPIVVIERESRKFAKKSLNIPFDTSIKGDIAFNPLLELTIPITIYRFKNNLGIVHRSVSREIEKYRSKYKHIVVVGVFDNISVYGRNEKGDVYKHIFTLWRGHIFY